MDLVQAYFGPVIDNFYRALMERDYTQDDPEGRMLTAALTNILRLENRGDRSTEVLLMTVWGDHGVINRSSLSVKRWRNRTLSGSYLDITFR